MIRGNEGQPIGWIITKDHLKKDTADWKSRVGYTSQGWDSETDSLATTKFRLYDDDGILYYEGRLIDDEWGDSQDWALEWGKYDAGCTTIKVLIGRKWKQEIA
jgi:hypothetical protein